MVSPLRGMSPPDLSERGQYPLPGGRCFAALVRAAAQGRTKIAICRTHRVIHYGGASSFPTTGTRLSLSNKACAFCLPGWFVFPCSCLSAPLALPLPLHIPCKLS